jgi:predicted GNAT superfamily acetyltransferase
MRSADQRPIDYARAPASDSGHHGFRLFSQPSASTQGPVHAFSGSSLPAGLRIRDVAPADLPAMLGINNAAVPAMNTLDPADLAWLVDHAGYARVAEADGEIIGFLIALPPGTQYASANYRWFGERYASFLYIDRVAIAAPARGRGIGSAMYADLSRVAAGRYECLLAEVNAEPPNPESVRFHERNGFIHVGELEHHYDGAHASRVLMMRRPLSGWQITPVVH